MIPEHEQTAVAINRLTEAVDRLGESVETAGRMIAAAITGSPPPPPPTPGISPRGTFT